MLLHVKLSSGERHTLDVDPTETTVADLKALLATRAGFSAELMRLVHKGRVLQDAKTLLSYGVEADHTIHCVRSRRVRAAAAARGARPDRTRFPCSASASPPPASAAPAAASPHSMFGGMPGGDDAGARSRETTPCATRQPCLSYSRGWRREEGESFPACVPAWL